MVKKTSNSVYREVPYLSAQILNEKSAFSPATANQQRICCLVYPESTQISPSKVLYIRIYNIYEVDRLTHTIFVRVICD